MDKCIFIKGSMIFTLFRKKNEYLRTMDSCRWCSTCGEMYEYNDKNNGKNTDRNNNERYENYGNNDNNNGGDEHELNGHVVWDLCGGDVDVTVEALDDMITHGLKTLKNREQQIQNAREVKADIDMLRNQFIENSKARIERIVKDVRVAMEYRAQV